MSKSCEHMNLLLNDLKINLKSHLTVLLKSHFKIIILAERGSADEKMSINPWSILCIEYRVTETCIRNIIYGGEQLKIQWNLV